MVHHENYHSLSDLSIKWNVLSNTLGRLCVRIIGNKRYIFYLNYLRIYKTQNSHHVHHRSHLLNVHNWQIMPHITWQVTMTENNLDKYNVFPLYFFVISNMIPNLPSFSDNIFDCCHLSHVRMECMKYTEPFNSLISQ